MIGIVNKDMSFFEISSSDVSLAGNDFNKNLISLSITERMDGLPQGSLVFYDPDNIYSRILRSWCKLNISWGYKNFVPTPESNVNKLVNPDEITGDLIRRGLEVLISDPSGEGGNDGVIKYKCNFTSFQWRGSKASKKYESGNKAYVVKQAMSDLGISAFTYINFKRGSEIVDSDRAIFQDETSFSFLSRMAREWHAVFRIGWNQDGKPVGIFIDPEKLGDPLLPIWTLGAIGSSNVIGYKGQINNVKSFSWQRSESESNNGSNIQVKIVNGQTVFKKYLAETETVKTYKLNVEKIQKVFKDKANDGIAEQTKLASELLSQNDFQSLLKQGYFTEVDMPTAPQGFGYRVKLEMMGNPLFTPPNIITFNNGFPDCIGNTKTRWYINEVTHTVDTSGYNMSVEVIDAFALSETGNPVL
jgi:hypothetical protein